MTSFARVCKLGKPDFEMMVLHAQNTGHNINRIILDMQKNLSNYIQAINYRTTAALSWGSRVSYELSVCLVTLVVYSPQGCCRLWFIFIFSRWKSISI